MKGVTYSCILLVVLMVLPLFTACGNTSATGSREYDHLKERYGFYDNGIFIVLSPEQPDEDFAAARDALRGTEIPKSYEMFEAILVATTGNNVEESLQRAHCLNAMGISKTITSDYLEAEDCFAQAEALYLEMEGLDSISAALCRHNWANVYYHQNESERAGELLQTAVETLESGLPSAHPDLAAVYLLYGKSARTLGNKDAEKYYAEKAYEIAKAAYGENDLVTYACQGGVFLALRLQDPSVTKDLKAAKQFYQQQLAFVEQELGTEHPYVATILFNTALCNMQMGDFSVEILDNLNRAEEIFSNAYGDVNDAMYYVHTFQYMYYIRLGENEKALEPAAKCVHMVEKKMPTGQKNWQYAHAIGCVGDVYIYMGKHEKAISYYAKTLYILITFTNEDDSIASLQSVLQKAYDYCNYSDEPFEEWFEAEMERQAELIDQPLPVEGYEYLYE